MLKSKSLEDIVKEKVHLGYNASTGWHYVDCPICGDKRLRGGFKFDSDTTGYACWNCQSKAKYEEGTGKLSRNFRQILEAFGITREDLQQITSALFLQQEEKETISIESLTKVSLVTPEVAFPDQTKQLLSEGHEEFQEPILEYLIGRRIDPVKTKWYFSLEPKMLRRVIVPYWRDGKLIYWQARHIDRDVKPRYLNCVVSKEAVIYGYDRLYSYDNTPLFVTEGVFDAEIVEGVSILGSSLNAAKIEILKRSKRRLIFVIDRDRTGGELGKAVLENDWELTFVDLRASDINDSAQKFGLPFTAYSLIKNATSKDNKLQSSISLSMGLMEARLRGRK